MWYNTPPYKPRIQKLSRNTRGISGKVNKQFTYLGRQIPSINARKLLNLFILHFLSKDPDPSNYLTKVVTTSSLPNQWPHPCPTLLCTRRPLYTRAWRPQDHQHWRGKWVRWQHEPRRYSKVRNENNEDQSWSRSTEGKTNDNILFVSGTLFDTQQLSL